MDPASLFTGEPFVFPHRFSEIVLRQAAGDCENRKSPRGGRSLASPADGHALNKEFAHIISARGPQDNEKARFGRRDGYVRSPENSAGRP